MTCWFEKGRAEYRQWPDGAILVLNFVLCILFGHVGMPFGTA
jgi:hypothetical protein